MYVFYSQVCICLHYHSTKIPEKSFWNENRIVILIKIICGTGRGFICPRDRELWPGAGGLLRNVLTSKGEPL